MPEPSENMNQNSNKEDNKSFPSPTGYTPNSDGSEGDNGEGQAGEQGQGGSNSPEGQGKQTPSVSTGYEKPPEDPPDPIDPNDSGADDEDLGIIDTNGLSQEQVKGIKQIAKDHKLPAKAIKNLVDHQKSQNRQLEQQRRDQQKEAERQKSQQKQKWYNELKQDPDFGQGNDEVYATRVKQANKVVEEHLPNLKKELTQSGRMMPPYFMKDLVALHKRLYGTENFNEGEGPAEDESKGKKTGSPLDFYRR